MRGLLSENVKQTLTAASIATTATSTSPYLSFTGFEQNLLSTLITGDIAADENITIILDQAKDSTGTDSEENSQQVINGGIDARRVSIDVQNAEEGDVVILDDVYQFTSLGSSTEEPAAGEFEDAAGLAALINAIGGYTAEVNGHVVTVYKSNLEDYVSLELELGDTSAWSALPTSTSAESRFEFTPAQFDDGFTFGRVRVVNNTAGTVVTGLVLVQSGAVYKPV